MMKKMMALLLAGSMLMAGCAKKESTACTSVSPASEEPTIIAYNTTQGYTTAVKNSSGMYYQIVNAGTGVQPSANSQVTVNYVGKLFNGTTFDSNTSTSGVQFPLYNLIQGWQMGIPLIRVGGTIRLMVPSAFAYGCQGSSPTIPPNTPLFFEIKLLAVN